MASQGSGEIERRPLWHRAFEAQSRQVIAPEGGRYGAWRRSPSPLRTAIIPPEAPQGSDAVVPSPTVLLSAGRARRSSGTGRRARASGAASIRATPRDVRRWARRGAELVTPLLLGALLPACATLTVAEERQLGAQMAREVRAEMRFIRDPVVVDYVSTIGGRIVRAAGPQPFEYHFIVVEDDEINAFAGPGGYVYVHTETILRARNASELAAVLAHEIGHVVLRHHAKAYARSRGAGTIHQAAVLAASVFGYGGLANLGGGLAAMTVLNSFTRSEERQADTFAIEILPAAGYDPNGLVTFLDVVRREGGPVAPSFLSSHPGAEDRIAETTGLVAAQSPMPGLRVTDRGRLEIIQRRIELLTGKVRPTGRTPL